MRRTDASGADPEQARTTPHAAIPGPIIPQPPAGTENDAQANIIDVGAQRRRAFATHPDPIRGARDWTNAVHARFFERHPDSSAAGGLATLAIEARGLAPALDRTDRGWCGGELVALRTPAIFLRTTNPLPTAVMDACASGGRTHRVRRWVPRACLVDLDRQASTDVPFPLAPRDEDWQRHPRVCQMDAWVRRDRAGHPRPEARATPRQPAPGGSPVDPRQAASR